MKKLASISAPVTRLFRAGLDRFGAGGWTVFLLLILAVAGLGWYLAAGENPWERGVPEKLENEQRLSIRDTIVCGLWAASLINLILALGLIGLAKFWGRKVEPAPVAPVTSPPVAVSGRLFWIAVLLAVAAGAWIRAPRLDQSLWNDEEQAFRKFTWGQHVLVEKDGKTTVEFQATGWDRALFYSVNGNNHAFHTVFAKASHVIWRSFQPPGPETFNMSVIRIEPFISGLLAIGAIAFWLRGLGFPIAGVAASWLLALHPWYLRYSVEARGYAALLLFVILAFWFLGLALRDNHRWRWWLAYGAAQCLYLLCFAGAAYLAATLNLIVLGTLIYRRDATGFWRWLVVCVMGAMGFLQVMTAPALRFMNWAESPDVPPFAMDFAFFRDFWTHLLLGAPWASGDPELHRYTSFRDETGRSFLRMAGLKIVIPLLLMAGISLSLWKNADLRRFFAALILAAALIWIHNIIADLTFFVWYALYILLGFVVALAVIPEAAISIISEKKRHQKHLAPIAITAAVSIVAGFAWLTHEPRSRLRAFDRHPMRQAVELVRGETPALGEQQAELLTGSVGSGANQMRTYDPWLRWLKKESDLDAIIDQARKTGKPLVVYCCSPRQVKRQMAGLYGKLEDRSLFVRVETGETLKGLEEYWSYRIYRFIHPEIAP